MLPPIPAIIVFFSPLLLAADEAREVPTSPNTWAGDFADHVEATPRCPGGTVEGLRRHMTVSDPFDSPGGYLAATNETLPQLRGLKPGDAFRQFRLSRQLADGSFWGFGGYVIERAGCIVHAEVTSHDN